MFLPQLRCRLTTGRRRAQGKPTSRVNFRPQILCLEERCLLSTVTNLKDSGPGSLRQAIAETPITGTVDFQAGLSGTITLTSGPLTIANILTIDGPGASVITLSGNKTQQVFIIPAQYTVTISGLTIANAKGSGGSFDGGAISNSGSLSITGCTFNGNSATDGAGIVNTGTLTVSNSTFSGNHANNSGGGIFNNHGTVKVTNCTFSSNSNINYGGGALFNFDNSTLTVANCAFSGNSAGSNPSYGGGGIYNGGTLTVTSSTFGTNSSGGIGGGISNTGAGNATIANSTFNLNIAVNGAGIYHADSGTLTLTSSTLNGNFASKQGGGIFHTGNGKAVVHNTILAGNSAPSSPDVMGALNSQGHNLIGDGAGGSGYTGTDLHGTAASPIDPLLGKLQDNGGPTIGAPGNTITLQTEALLPGSPAIDAGDNANAPATDERGLPRIVNGTTDIGAFEVQNPPPAVTQLALMAPPIVNAGVPFNLMVSAEDNNGNVVTGYTGTIAFTSSDLQATLPADYTFAASDSGVHTFENVSLLTAGTQMVLVATDTMSSGIAGKTTINVLPVISTVDHLVISAQATVVAGTPFDVTVKAVDAQGDAVQGYMGTVHFTSSDPYPGVLPSDYTFTADDNGAHNFTGVTLFTAGSQKLTAQDTATNSLMDSTTISVSPAAANQFFITAPSSTVAGMPFDAMVIAEDPYGNVDTGYTGTVLLITSDHSTRPSDYTFTQSDTGTHLFGLSLFTAGAQTLLVRDAANGTIMATVTVVVDPAAADHFLVKAPSTSSSGSPFDLIVIALDPYGNIDANYQGTVSFTSSDADPGVVLPAAYTFTTGDGGDDGVHAFPSGVTLITPGDQTLIATDTSSGIAGKVTITVNTPAAPPGGAANRPPNRSLQGGNTLVGSVPAALDVAWVDRLFASLDQKDSATYLARIKHVGQAEASRNLLDSFYWERAVAD